MLFSQQCLRLDLRQGIGPSRINQSILVDAMSGFGQYMDQHRAGEDELFDLKLLKMLQQPFRATHGDLLVEWARFAGEVVVRGEMDR